MNTHTHANTQGQHYYAVFDGHGGFECAEFAHTRLSGYISSCLQESKAATPEERMEVCGGVGNGWLLNVCKHACMHAHLFICVCEYMFMRMCWCMCVCV